jgi:hypothetical protein
MARPGRGAGEGHPGELGREVVAVLRADPGQHVPPALQGSAVRARGEVLPVPVQRRKAGDLLLVLAGIVRKPLDLSDVLRSRSTATMPRSNLRPNSHAHRARSLRRNFASAKNLRYRGAGSFEGRGRRKQRLQTDKETHSQNIRGSSQNTPGRNCSKRTTQVEVLAHPR